MTAEAASPCSGYCFIILTLEQAEKRKLSVNQIWSIPFPTSTEIADINLSLPQITAIILTRHPAPQLQTIIWRLNKHGWARFFNGHFKHSPPWTAPVSGCLWWRKDTPCLPSCGHSVYISNLQEHKYQSWESAKFRIRTGDLVLIHFGATHSNATGSLWTGHMWICVWLSPPSRKGVGWSNKQGQEIITVVVWAKKEKKADVSHCKHWSVNLREVRQGTQTTPAQTVSHAWRRLLLVNCYSVKKAAESPTGWINTHRWLKCSCVRCIKPG